MHPDNGPGREARPIQPWQVEDWKTAFKAGSAALQRGKPDEAIEFAERAVTLADQQFDDRDARWVDFMNHIPPLLEESGRPEQAILLIDRSIERISALHPRETTALAHFKCTAGFIRFHHDFYEEADEYFVSALRDCDSSLDQCPVRRSVVLLHRSPVLCALGEVERANEALHEVSEILEELKPADLETLAITSLQCASNLALRNHHQQACQVIEDMLRSFDSYDKAVAAGEETQNEAIAGYPEALRDRLARYYAHRGMEREAISTMEASYPSKREVSLDVMLERAGEVAMFFGNLGKHERASLILQDALGDAQRALGVKEHVKLVAPFLNLAGIETSRNHYVNAKQYVEVGLNILEKDRSLSENKKASFRGQALFIKGESELSLGNPEEALGDMQEGLDYFRQSPRVSRRRVAIAAMKLSQAMVAVEDFDGAEEYIDGAIELLRAPSPQAKNLEYGVCFHLKAAVASRKGEVDQVGDLLERAEHAMNRASPGVFRSPHIRLFNDIALHRRSMGDFNSALSYLEKAHGLCEDLNQTDQIISIQVSDQLAAVYRTIGRDEEAALLEKRSTLRKQQLDLMNDGLLFENPGDFEA